MISYPQIAGFFTQLCTALWLILSYILDQTSPTVFIWLLGCTYTNERVGDLLLQEVTLSRRHQRYGGGPVMSRHGANGTCSEERAVSPVVGVVLMLAITVAMVAVAAPLVLTQSGDVVDEQPDVDIAYAYTEDVDSSDEDVFDRTKDDVDGNGTLAILFESGDSVPAEQLTVDGAASSGNLVADGSFEDDEDVSAGTEFTVWASRGDTVRLIWTAPDSDESALLGEFTVRPAP